MADDSFKIRADVKSMGIIIELVLDGKKYDVCMSALDSLRICNEIESALNSISIYRRTPN